MAMRPKRYLVMTGLVQMVLAGVAWAELRPAFVFSDDMVLQQQLLVPVWGKADANAEVTVTFGSQHVSTTADEQGRWKVSLAPLAASEKPETMTIVSGVETKSISNIVVGEVWLCSGQSNMEKPIGTQPGQKPTVNAKEEIAAANYPNIRFIQIPKTADAARIEASSWKVCTPENIDDPKQRMSATAYFFGRKIHKDLGVPVGLIHSSWGGTRIEPWTPPEAFGAFPELAAIGEAAKARGATTRGANGAPSGLYNAMIKPLVPFAIRGAIWYQGESNVMQFDRGVYLVKQKALIQGWREVFGRADMPFLFVQLAPYSYTRRSGLAPTRDDLPAVWETQLRAVREIANTGMVVTTDITGNVADIHPVQKREVGERLALWALAGTYGKDLVCSGPLYKGVEFKGTDAIVSFDYAKGLKAKDDKLLSYFEIAGEDQVFRPAMAKVVGETVVVSSAMISKPVAVRFAWNEEAEPNLANGARLPASPFRTDDFELAAVPKPQARGPITQPSR